MKTYEIYQLPVEHDATFMGLNFVLENNIMPKMVDYREVFSGEIEESVDLDDIYRRFNIGRKPENYKGRSLSVSDVVKVNGECFYCDEYGWERVNLL